MLLVVSMDDRGKFVDGDVNARVRDGSKGRVVVWLMTDGGVDGDMGERGHVKGRGRGGWKSGATLKRTGSQTKADGKGRDRKRDMFCADSVTTVESDRSCQSRVGRTERTAEEREERGHDMRGGGGRQEDTLNSSIVNVGDLVLGLIIIARRCRCRGGAGSAGLSWRQERDQDRASIWKEEIVDPRPHLFHHVFRSPPSPPPHRPHAPSPPPTAEVPKVKALLLLQIKSHPPCLAPAPARPTGATSHNRPSLARKECIL